MTIKNDDAIQQSEVEFDDLEIGEEIFLNN